MRNTKTHCRLIILVIIILLPFRSTILFAEKEYGQFQISLLTYSPGEKLYSIFGHSALRVYDKSTDWVYNYGTFDFDDPHFYLNFLKGELMYRLSRMPFNYVLKNIEQENRSLIETPLLLSVEQKAKVIKYLEMNYLPENREYRYDFLFNNCATKIIDVINFGTSNLTGYNPMATPHWSFRQLLYPYLEKRPWIHMGVDFLMGLPADRKTEGTEASFLPDYLHLQLKNARIAEISGNDSELSLSDKIHFHEIPRKQKSQIKPEWVLWPLVLICMISLIFGTYFSVFFTWLNNALLLSFGAIGFILLLMWIVTDHYIFNFNPDLLWANPLFFIIPFLKIKTGNKTRYRTKIFFLFLLLFLASLGTVLSIIIERNLNVAAVSILILTALYEKIRTIYRVRDSWSTTY